MKANRQNEDYGREQLHDRPIMYWVPVYSDDEFGLFNALKSVSKHWRLVLLATLIGGLGGAIYAWGIAEKTYRASAGVRATSAATLLPLNLTAYQQVTPGEAIERFVVEATSRAVHIAALEKSLLAARSSGVSTDGVTPGLDPTELAKEVRTNTDLAMGVHFTLSFQHRNPQFAADVVNAIVAEAEDRARATFVDELSAARRINETLIAERNAKAKDMGEFSGTAESASASTQFSVDKTRMIRVDSPALPPTVHSKPHRLLISTGSAFAGFIASVLFAVAQGESRTLQPRAPDLKSS
ncbi:MAG: Wzz/FepE/Etk N-terminal domain-containing protein [Pseudomonadota bacterium]